MNNMVSFMAGAVACTYAIAGVFFLKFWRRTRERLFLSFAAAFFLLAINQFVINWMEASDERRSLVYLLRIVGFVVILYAIVDKNIKSRPPRRGE